MSSVLVGIVTKNRAGLLPASISSALSQKHCPIRVSVIDDDSSDETASVAKQFPRVEWIHWAPSRGYLAARNHWMSTAKEDFFVSLDDDAWFLQGDEISQAISVFEANPKAAAVAFDILTPDRPDVVARSAPRNTAMFIGCGHVLRLSALKSIGVYIPMSGLYGGEEKDICLRLLDSDYQIIHLPGVHVWHDKTMVARDFSSQHQSGVCNDLVMTLRRTPMLLLPLAMGTKIFRHLSHSFKQGILSSCFKGFQQFIGSMPSAARSRQPVKVSTLREFMKLNKT